MKTESRFDNGYPPDGIGGWATRARDWTEGRVPADLARVEAPAVGEARPRDAYLFFISGAKERAPAAAVATLAALGLAPPAEDLPT